MMRVSCLASISVGPLDVSDSVHDVVGTNMQRIDSKRQYGEGRHPRYYSPTELLCPRPMKLVLWIRTATKPKRYPAPVISAIREEH